MRWVFLLLLSSLSLSLSLSISLLIFILLSTFFFSGFFLIDLFVLFIAMKYLLTMLLTFQIPHDPSPSPPLSLSLSLFLDIFRVIKLPLLSRFYVHIRTSLSELKNRVKRNMKKKKKTVV